MIRVRILLQVCLLVVHASSLARADMMEQWLESEKNHRNLFLRSSGQLGEICGRNTLCAEGLQCVRSFARSTCLPLDCAEDVILTELVDKLDIENYGTKILAAANIEMGDDMFNETTMALGEGALNEFGLRHILKDNFQTSIVNAMLANPLNMTDYLARLESCTAGKQGGGGGTAGSGGFVLTIAAAFKFQYSYYYIQGTADDAGSIYSNLCFGLGPQAGLTVGGMGAVGFASKKKDFLSCSCQFDAGFTAIAGLDVANVYTIPDQVQTLEFHLNSGAYAGGNLGFCYVDHVANYGDPFFT
ncbi:expressed unknown protein [Seminavis robusta]|uniref:Uncharacterized protein n=1 Tax=Seminavis robusta TaxID=568900 RepID=A0A9N8F1G1_9STRA|nr:expressed unknown protein [Seminavis robusta]|eukprot:Sro2340_g324030.1 n/a (301) ;mRNA; f:10670-11572